MDDRVDLLALGVGWLCFGGPDRNPSPRDGPGRYTVREEAERIRQRRSRYGDELMKRVQWEREASEREAFERAASDREARESLARQKEVSERATKERGAREGTAMEREGRWCWHFGKRGHTKKDCWSLQGEENGKGKGLFEPYLAKRREKARAKAMARDLGSQWGLRGQREVGASLNLLNQHPNRHNPHHRHHRPRKWSTTTTTTTSDWRAGRV